MKLIADGCPRCEPQVNPTGDREGEHHASVRFGDDVAQIEVWIDGKKAWDIREAWAGTPGRVIRFQLNDQPVQLCPCTPPYMHNDPTWDAESRKWIESTNDPKVFRQLIEYDLVEIRAKRCRD